MAQQDRLGLHDLHYCSVVDGRLGLIVYGDLIRLPTYLRGRGSVIIHQTGFLTQRGHHRPQVCNLTPGCMQLTLLVPVARTSGIKS